jgi:hypothetical protein
MKETPMRPSKIYLASRFPRHEEMASYAIVLRNMGHEITSEWHDLDTQHKMRDGDPEVEFNQRLAFNDQQGIFKCEVFVNFTEDSVNPPPGSARGGRHVELGLAIGYGKAVIVAGPRENVFHYLPEVLHFPTIEEWLAYMLAPSGPDLLDDLANVPVRYYVPKHPDIKVETPEAVFEEAAGFPLSDLHRDLRYRMVDDDPPVFRAKGFSRP